MEKLLHGIQLAGLLGSMLCSLVVIVLTENGEPTVTASITDCIFAGPAAVSLTARLILQHAKKK